MTFLKRIMHPVLHENPVSVQILGLCSALAVTSSVKPALIMSVSVTAVLLFSNVAVSMMRHIMPGSIRLILETTLIASAVIVVDELLKAFAPEVSQVLTVFVGLIVTNCIVLGRAETFALHNTAVDSAADAIGNGLGYSLILVFVAAVRELFGAGTLLGMSVLPLLDDGGWYRPNEMMLYAPSGFFIIGVLIWIIRAWRPEQVERPEYPPPQFGYRDDP